MQVIQREIKIRIRKKSSHKKGPHVAQFEDEQQSEICKSHLTRSQLTDSPQLTTFWEKLFLG